MPSVTLIYVNYIEPFLCLAYAYLMWRIIRSNAEELHSSFFSFFILSGIASCLNIFVIGLNRIANLFLPIVPSRDLVFNCLIFGSHSFSLSHSIGKTLIIISRFTAICYPLSNFWTPFRTNLGAFLMFIIPALVYSFMIPPQAIYRRNNETGQLSYVGVEVWAQELSKLISATSYLLFIIISFPLCAVSIYYLRKAQVFNQTSLVQHERSLLFYTIAIAVVHLLKSAQQIFWFATMIMDDVSLFYVATAMYNHINALTTFLPPLLLIGTSKIVRRETLPGFRFCMRHRLQFNPAIAQSSSFNTGSTQGRNQAS